MFFYGSETVRIGDLRFGTVNTDLSFVRSSKQVR